MENVNLKAMSNKCFGNGKATMNNGFSTFLFMLAYKQRDRGHYLVKIDKRFPLSLMCRCCGMKNPAVKDVRVRKWKYSCGVHDRDENAAITIDRDGLRLLLSGELEKRERNRPNMQWKLRKPVESLGTLPIRIGVVITGTVKQEALT
ncbi:MAG: transposase [Desulfovibrio sp.]|nr:transposase [Desulfovibrio sp.]